MNAINNLSKAIQFKTISHKKIEDFDFSEFSGFLEFLKESYPLVHRNLELKMINNYAPLFHWKSGSSKLPLLFLAHYDVVPVNESSWSVNPFSGEIKDGKVWGRGAIDDKNSIIGLMETTESLLAEGYQPTRDIYFAFGYDEETMGAHGAKRIAEYMRENNMQFEVILDEGGIVTPGSMMGIARDIAVVGVAEKGQCNYQFTFTGQQGHSSAPPEHTAVGKMAAFIKDVEDHPMAMRLTEPVAETLINIGGHKRGIEKFLMTHVRTFFPIIKKTMAKGAQTNALIRTTVAFTMARGGTAANVLPDKASVTANVRVLPGDTPESVEDWFKSFNHQFEMARLAAERPTAVSKTNNGCYGLLKRCIENVFNQPVVTPYLMIGGTDSRNYQGLSDKIYRFMPCRLTSEELALMHADDEYISIDNFNKMIEFYTLFIKAMNEEA